MTLHSTRHSSTGAQAFCVLLMALMLPAGCGGENGKGLRADYPPLKSAEMGSMLNVCVSGPIWFGGQPTVEDLDLAKRRGIESVIGLCETDSETRLQLHASDLGMEYLLVPIKPGLATPAGTVDLVIGKLAASASKPTLMFCDNGGVSAMFFAIYRVVFDGVDPEEALIEARKAGMKPGAPEEFVLEQVERLTGVPQLARHQDSGE